MPHFIKYSCVFLLLFIFSVRVSAQQKGDPPSVKEGIQVSRSHLIMRIQSSDSSMVFKQMADVDGKTYYAGIDNNGTTVDVFGEENRVNKAVFTYKFTTNLDVNSLQYTRMSYFAYLLSGKEGLTWLEDCLTEFIKDPQKAMDKKGEFFLRIKGFCKYSPDDKAITLSFTD